MCLRLFRLPELRTTIAAEAVQGWRVEVNTDNEGFHARIEDERDRFEQKWPLGTRQRLAFSLLLSAYAEAMP